MSWLARIALVVPLAVTTACQALLVFTPEHEDASAIDASTIEASAPDVVTSDASDVVVRPDAATDCAKGVCINFEQGSDVSSYGFDSGASIDLCPTTESPNNHCLKWTQPGWRSSRKLEVGGGLFRWEAWIDCTNRGATDSGAYATFVSFDYAWVVLACTSDATGTSILLMTHDSLTGTPIDSTTLGPSPARARVDINLPLRQVTLVDAPTTHIAMPDSTPQSVLNTSLGVGATEGALFEVRLDDIALTRP